MNAKLLFNLLIALQPLFNGCRGQTQSDPLKLISTIPLSYVSGRIDHLSFDNKHQRIFVAALGNNTVEVVDLKNNRSIHSIKDLSEPQGVVFIPESNTLFVANGDNGECDIFNTESFQKISSIKLDGDADNVRYDSEDNKIFVGYGNGGIAIIDATTFTIIAKIQLSGHPESFQIDKSKNKIYVNVPDKKLIEVIDLNVNAVTSKWKMTEATSNFPMSLDAINHRLFVGCRHVPRLLVIDTKTGETIASLDIDRDVDDIFYNADMKEIYLSCGSGHIDVFKQEDAGTYRAIGKISTQLGARTCLYVAELNELIIASPAGINNNASLLIYSTK